MTNLMSAADAETFVRRYAADNGFDSESFTEDDWSALDFAEIYHSAIKRSPTGFLADCPFDTFNRIVAAHFGY